MKTEKPKHDKLTKTLDLITTVSAIIAAYLIPHEIWEVYWVFLVSNITGIWLQWRVGLTASLIRNLFFLGSTLSGIYLKLL